MLTLLTLAAVVVFALLAFVVGVAIGRTGRDALRAELHRLRELHSAQKATLETLDRGYEDMKRIASNALEIAHKQEFPETTEKYRAINAEIARKANGGSVARSMPNYIPPIEKWCPECNVSVRQIEWPAECPACGSVFGFDES